MPIFQAQGKLYYFAHVPKCAGTSVERYLIQRFGPLGFLDWGYGAKGTEEHWNRSSPQHVDAKSFARLIPDSFLAASFAVVRHPVDRLLSTYRYQRDAEQQIPAEMGFGAWLRDLPAQPPFFLDNHTLPMSRIVPENAVIFRMEEGLNPLTEWLDAETGTTAPDLRIGQKNSYLQRLARQGLPKGTTVEVTPEDLDWIAEHYAEDFAQFGYDPQVHGQDLIRPSQQDQPARPLQVLVFGTTGQVGLELQQQVPPGIELTALSRQQAPLTNPEFCRAHIAEAAPDMVINAAAYTAVDKAESDEDLAMVVNGTAPTAMAQACAILDIPFVHISTDYVFAGTGDTPWRPDDPTGPLGVYGRSKLKGEEGVRAAGGPHAILRTSWVVSAHGNNFVKTMLRLGKERDRLSVVADQVGAPTDARAIAQACLEMARQLRQDPKKSGTYHLAGTPETTWAGVARAIFLQTGIACVVEDIPSSEYPTPAARPLNSRMDCQTLQDTFGIARPEWRAGLERVLKELGELGEFSGADA